MQAPAQTAIALMVSMIHLLRAAVWEGHPSDIHLSGRVECPLILPDELWCFNVYLQEVDTFSNDRIEENGTKCVRGRSREYDIKKKIYGDGYRDNFYEFRVVIRHNCSTNGYRRLMFDFQEPVNKSLIIRERNYIALSTALTSTRVSDLNEY